MGEATSLPQEGALPSLRGATGWLNSQPLSAADLRGKVVLVDFWTYTCINWRRTLPYVRAWAAKYKQSGLVVLGVHTPEFSFEKDAANIRRAIAEMGIDYPVAIDSGRAVWRAFRNEYWPALYFVDAAGRIRHHWFGEGAYEESEAVIQQLLQDAGASGFDRSAVRVNPEGVEVAADWRNLQSPEAYAGYQRAENFVSPGGAAPDQSRAYRVPGKLARNQWALDGDWTVGAESVRLNRAHGRFALRFHARDLHLVMGAARREASTPFQVTIDGRPPGESHGSDVDEQGNGTAAGPRLYQLLRQPGPIGDRLFEIEFLEPGADIFSFTFG